MITDAEIAAIPPKGIAYKYFVGEGLFVHVLPDGKKYWRLKYRFNGRETTYAMGVFPEITVAAALKAKTLVRESLRQGADPNEIKRQEKESRQKLVSKSVFRLALSSKDELTIETVGHVLNLDAPQTKALRAFLVATPESEQEGQQ